MGESGREFEVGKGSADGKVGRRVEVRISHKRVKGEVMGSKEK